MNIGEKIRKVREIKGLKQDTVAKELGISVTAYGKIERGETNITFNRFEEIAVVLGVSAHDIFNLPDELNIQIFCNNPNNGGTSDIQEKTLEVLNKLLNIVNESTEGNSKN